MRRVRLFSLEGIVVLVAMIGVFWVYPALYVDKVKKNGGDTYPAAEQSSCARANLVIMTDHGKQYGDWQGAKFYTNTKDRTPITNLPVKSVELIGIGDRLVTWSSRQPTVVCGFIAVNAANHVTRREVSRDRGAWKVGYWHNQIRRFELLAYDPRLPAGGGPEIFAASGR